MGLNASENTREDFRQQNKQYHVCTWDGFVKEAPLADSAAAFNFIQKVTNRLCWAPYIRFRVPQPLLISTSWLSFEDFAHVSTR